ncbi:MAG: hypothetical protein GY849_09720 [Deltaproteobacteria bacterium]|nr:hypothetical protein [Deltaproteobacteria bacterium]
MSKPITTADVIEKAKQAFFKEMSAGIDMNALNEILSEEYEITIGDDMAFKDGNIITSNGQVFYELQYEVTLSLLIQLDAEGNPEFVRMEMGRQKPPQAPEEKAEDGTGWTEKMDESGENHPTSTM